MRTASTHDLQRRALETTFSNPNAARRFAGEAIAQARQAGSSTELMGALRTALRVHWCPLHLARLDDLAAELVVLATDGNATVELAHGLAAQMFAATVRGRSGEARTLLARITKLEAVESDPMMSVYRIQYEAQRAFAVGDLATVDRLIPQMVDRALGSGSDVAVQSAMALGLFREWSKGNDGPAHAVAAERASTDPWMIAWAIAQLSMDCLPGRDPELVGAKLRQLVGSDVTGLIKNHLWLGELVLIADIARFVGDAELGAACHRALLPHCDLFVPLGAAMDVGSAWFGLAAASAAVGDIDRAATEYDLAIEANEQVGYRTWAVAARGRKAETLYRTGRRNGARHVSIAREEAARVELWPMVTTLESLDKVDPPSPLSARETDVVLCLAKGATNKEIAGSLTISVKTVERHLANISTKIGASNRLEIALWALEHQPLPLDQSEDAVLLAG